MCVLCFLLHGYCADVETLPLKSNEPQTGNTLKNTEDVIKTKLLSIVLRTSLTVE